MESMIRDIKLAPSGHDKINWVKNFMPVMAAVDKEFSVSKPFAGKKMVITLHASVIPREDIRSGIIIFMVSLNGIKGLAAFLPIKAPFTIFA